MQPENGPIIPSALKKEEETEISLNQIRPRLEKAGFKSIDSLAGTNPKELAEAIGISLQIATSIRYEARAILSKTQSCQQDILRMPSFTPFQTEPSKSRIGTANRPGQIYVSLPTFESSEPHAIEQIYHLEQFCEGVHKREINTLDNITRLHTMLIDERIRFNLIADSPMGDLLMNPTNPLTYLYLHDTEMEKLSNIIFDEFGLHVYLDSTSDGILRIRVNEEQWQKRRSHDDDALEFMGRSSFKSSRSRCTIFCGPAYCCY